MANQYLTEAAWKAAVQKYKIGDNGLLKALGAYERLSEERHDERLRALAAIKPLAGKLKTLLLEGLKTAKAQKAKPEVMKNLDAAIDHLSQTLHAVENAQKEIEVEKEQAVAAIVAQQAPMIDRLTEAAATISGSPGARLRKVMAIARRKGPAWKSLWYYNDLAAGRFVQFHTTQGERAQMTRASGGKMPFRGDSGHGPWVIEPFADSLPNICRPGCPEQDLVTFLKSLDGKLLYSVAKMSQVQNAGEAAGGGSGFGPSVDEFLSHVGTLAKDPTHLYSAGY